MHRRVFIALCAIGLIVLASCGKKTAATTTTTKAAATTTTATASSGASSTTVDPAKLKSSDPKAVALDKSVLATPDLDSPPGPPPGVSKHVEYKGTAQAPPPVQGPL